MKKPNNSISSEKLNDGVCYVYPVDRNDDIVEDEGLRLFFGERNLTAKRIYEARQMQMEYSRIIAVPLIRGKLDKIKCCIIYGRRYRIESIQEIHTSLPAVAVLGLSEWDIDAVI